MKPLPFLLMRAKTTPAPPRRGLKKFTQSALAILSLSWPCLGMASATFAQMIQADGTTGPVFTCLGSCTIPATNGTQVGSNLFHSFIRFNVDTGTAVYFADPGVVNILGRVTLLDPSNISTIAGTLGVSGGTANLFLMNPNGIVFGSGARLDLQGSFVATTASGIRLQNGDVFSADRTQPLPGQILAVNPNALLLNQIAAQPIAGITHQGNLQVANGQSLLLVGGDITLTGSGNVNANRGNLQAAGGRVELGGLTAPGSVELTSAGGPLALQFPEGVDRSDITLQEGARVDVTGTGGGSIALTGRNLRILGAPTLDPNISELKAGINPGGTPTRQAGDITLNATGDILITNRSRVGNDVNFGAIGSAGNIYLQGRSLNLLQSGRIQSLVFSTVPLRPGEIRNAGNIAMNITGDVAIEGLGDALRGVVLSRVQPGGNGNAGNITIRAGSLSMQKLAAIETAHYGSTNGDSATGNAGSVVFDIRDRVFIENSGVNAIAATDGGGNAGNITIKAETLEFGGGGPFLDVSNYSSGPGRGGNLQIDANRVLATDTIFLRSRLYSDGPSGSLTIAARAIDLNFRSIPALESLQESGLVAETYGSGNGSNITLTATDSINLTNVQLNTFSYGASNGGQIYLEAPVINLAGTGLVSGVRFGGTGSGGNIGIKADQLNLGTSPTPEVPATAATVISTAIEFAGSPTSQAGDIRLDVADELRIRGYNTATTPEPFFNYFRVPQGTSTQISTSVGRGSQGQGGRILINQTLVNPGRVILTEGGSLSATTSGTGNAGEIRLRASTLELSGRTDLPNGLPTSVITGTASQGNAGRIEAIADTVRIQEGAVLSSSTTSSGHAGNIDLTAKDVQVTGNGSISTSTRGSGNAGTIALQTNTLTLTDGGTIESRSTGTREPVRAFLSPISADRYATLILADQPLAYWRFEETGPTAIDSSGNGLNGTYQGDISLGNVKLIGGAAKFGEALTGRVELGQPDRPTPWTTEAWVVRQDSPGVQAEILSGPNTTLNLETYANTNQVGVTRPGAAGFPTGFVVPIGAPTHLAYVGNKEQLSIYVNGTLEGVVRGDFNLPFTSIGSASYSITGILDEVALFNSALSPETIQSHYQTGLAVQGLATQIVGYQEEGSNAGNIQITAGDTVRINGSGSGIFTGAENPLSGRSGAIAINAPLLQIQEGGELSAITRSNFGGGNIEVRTNRLELDRGGQITTASTGSGNAGDIGINARSALRMTGGNSSIQSISEQSNGGAIRIQSQDIRLTGSNQIISAVEGGPEAQGGNITIAANVFLAFNDSDILASARQGKGGNITIVAPAFLTENFFGRINQVSDYRIYRSNNQVDINNAGGVAFGLLQLPDLNNLQNNLQPLDANFVQTEQLITNSCLARRNRSQGSFVISSAGGLPTTPLNLLSEDYPATSLQPISDRLTQTLNQTPAVTAPIATTQNQPASPIQAIQEAHQLVKTVNGRILLVADATTIPNPTTQMCH